MVQPPFVNSPGVPISKSVPFYLLPSEEQSAWSLYWTSANRAGKVPAAIDIALVRSAMRNGNWPRMWVRPNLTPGAFDLRHHRPYFLVPLLETAVVGEHELLREEISQVYKSLGTVTDLYIFSHGWHRSFYEGIAAYDRLLMRLFGLIGRGRIEPKPGFSPLFLGFHWHSDPGADAWVDPGGRRDKADFLTRSLAIFKPAPKRNETALLSALEDAFVFMSQVSAPDMSIQDPIATAKALSVTSGFLAVAELRHWTLSKPPEHEVLITSLWGCFNESKKNQVLVDQDQIAEPVASPWVALRTIFSFLMGIPLILTFLWGRMRTLLTKFSPGDQLSHLLKFAHLNRFAPSSPSKLFDVAAWTLTLICAYLACILILYGFVIYNKVWNPKETRSAKGFPLLLTATWAVAQSIGTLPVFLVLLTSWIFRSAYVLLAIPMALLDPLMGNGHVGFWLAGFYASLVFLIANIQYYTGASLKGVFGERLRNAGDEPWTFRDYLAGIARFPINLVRESIGRDSALFDLTQAVDNQLAFYEFQRKGVDAGDDMGRFISKLLVTCPELEKARWHFIGHSFGGLVVLNGARRVFCGFNSSRGLRSPRKAARTKLKEERSKLDVAGYMKVDIARRQSPTNLVLVQGALASDWFRGEAAWANFLTVGASIYSKYDTANSFYYPGANNGRLSAGCVGLCKTPMPAVNVGGPTLAMVAGPPLAIEQSKARFLNVDASRIIYNGPVATGGGHSDIFKDDVVSLLWAITSHETEEQSSTGL